LSYGPFQASGISTGVASVFSICYSLRVMLADPSSIFPAEEICLLTNGAQGVSFAHAVVFSYQSKVSFANFSLVSRQLAIMCFIVAHNDAYNSLENREAEG
jgi:hypothetical protein